MTPLDHRSLKTADPARPDPFPPPAAPRGFHSNGNGCPAPPPRAAARQKVLERRRSPRMRRRAPSPHGAAAAPRGQRRAGERGGGGDCRRGPPGGAERQGDAWEPAGEMARSGFPGNRPPPLSRSKEELPPTLRKVRTRLRE